MTEPMNDELELELRERLTVLEVIVKGHEQAIATLALAVMCLAGVILLYRARTVK